MFSETQLLRLALMAYEAATEPEIWPLFLERYAEALDAEFAFLHQHDFGSGRSVVLAASAKYDSRLRQSYHEHFSKVNLWRDRGRRLFRTGIVLLEEEICPRPVTTHSEFYNDYLLRAGATRSMGVAIERVDEQALMIPPMRAENKEPFNEDDRELVRWLLPHLARANLIRQRLELLQASQEVLDSLAFGVAFLTSDSRLIHANRAAEMTFHQEDGLFVHAGKLSAQGQAGNSALRLAIRQAAVPENVTEWPHPVVVQRRSMLRSYQVLIAPVRGILSRFRGMTAPSAIALITDPERQTPLLPELLEHLYGLSKREAAVATKLAEGKPVEQLAQELGMRYETARTHLRRIYDKTGTSRQAELISLLARLPPHNRPSK